MTGDLLRFKKLIEDNKNADKLNRNFTDWFELHKYGLPKVDFVLGYRYQEMFSQIGQLIKLDDSDINYLYNKYVISGLDKEMNNKINEIKKQYGN